MYIDTHCHLLKNDYDNIEEIINEVGNNYIIVSGAEINDNKEVLELISKYKNIYGTIGLHPSEASKYTDKDIELIEKNLSNKEVVGIGEIGLDYHYGKEDIDKQKELFIKQLKLARKYNKAVTIHSRDALLDTYNIIKEYCDLKITYHCYGYSLEHAKELLKLNIKFGIGGVLTFKNSKTIKEVVEFLPLDNILLETDSPYLSPEPFRGKKNKPSNVQIVAKKIAEIKNIPYEKVLKVTLENAKKQFDLNI